MEQPLKKKQSIMPEIAGILMLLSIGVTAFVIWGLAILVQMDEATSSTIGTVVLLVFLFLIMAALTILRWDFCLNA
jgi:hypothetical protein